MNWLLLGKVAGVHGLLFVALLVSHVWKIHKHILPADKPNVVQVRMVAPTPPPPKPVVKPPEPRPTPKPPPPKPEPTPKKPDPTPRKTVPKPAPKPVPKPAPKPVEPPTPPAPTPEELLQRMAEQLERPPTPVEPPPAVIEPVPAPAPPRPRFAASDYQQLQARLEETCLGPAYQRYKPNGIRTYLHALAQVRVHRDGRIEFIKLLRPSGNPLMDTAVQRTIENANCRLIMPASAPEHADFAIEFELN